MARVPASIRSKNPGAMWANPRAQKWGGSAVGEKLNDGTGQNNNIAHFPTFVQGICAQLDLWRMSPNYRNKRFKDAIRIWSGGNHVESYIAFVKKRVPGITENTVMNDQFWLGPMGIPFLKAQAWHEAGVPYPAPEGDWLMARNIVFGKQPPVTLPEPKKPVSVPTKTGGAVTTGGAATAGAAQSGIPLWAACAIGVGIAVLVFVIWHFSKKKEKVEEADKPVVLIAPPAGTPVSTES